MKSIPELVRPGNLGDAERARASTKVQVPDSLIPCHHDQHLSEREGRLNLGPQTGPKVDARESKVSAYRTNADVRSAREVDFALGP